jgi:membrane-associated protease RseP (regulator of RpoE activity)
MFDILKFNFAMISCAVVFAGSSVQADDLVRPPAKPAETQEKVIQVHHHHYYGYGAFGPQATSTVSQASVFSPGFHPWYGGQVRPWDINWGKLGFYGYYGKQGENMGLIVSKVTPGSPAEQFGLVPGDMIVSIDGQDISDSSYRILEAIFAEITIKPKASVSMTVWNTTTRRTHTLKAQLVEDDR